MKQNGKILILLLAYIILCGKSCEDESNTSLQQEKAVQTEREGIRNEIDVAWLSEESKYVYEVAATQKLTDLADYLKIYTNPSLDTSFRNKAGEMIRNIFISTETRLSFSPYQRKKNKPIALKDLLEKRQKKNIRFAEVKFDSMHMVTPLQKSGTDAYRGILSSWQETSFNDQADPSKKFTAINVDVHVLRTLKIFGKDTLGVWNVFLGDMNIADQ